MVIGQVKTDVKSNEITAIPELIDAIDIKGSTVSIDAAGCQKKIAEKIIDNEADYLFALKGNQGTLLSDVEKYFHGISEMNACGKHLDKYEKAEKNSSRIEMRRCFVSTDVNWLHQVNDWESLRSIIMIHSQRVVKGSVQTEKRYYISSAVKNAEIFNGLVRGHWGVENGLHWVLDVAFQEDQCRVRSGYAAENFATLRHIALNLIKKDKTKKGGVKSKRLQAAWNPRYLEKLLNQLF